MLNRCGVGEMRNEGVRVSWMVVVGLLFVEMVGDIVFMGVGRSIFKINYNIFLFYMC